MAYTAPVTFIATAVLTAAQLNAMQTNIVALHESGGGFQLIQEIAVAGADAADITFAAIPGTFRHLKLIMLGRSDRAVTQGGIGFIFNADAGAHYDYRSISATLGASTAVTTQALAAAYGLIGNVPGSSASAGMASMLEVLIPYYANTSWQKQYSSQSAGKDSNSANAYDHLTVDTFAGYWRDTTAITAIKIYAISGNLKIGSICSLYGIT